MVWPRAYTPYHFYKQYQLQGSLQDGQNTTQAKHRKLEAYFVFACIWAFGGCLAVDKKVDHRLQFSRYWISEWKTITFPEQVRRPQTSDNVHEGLAHGCTLLHVHPTKQALLYNHHSFTDE